MKTTRHSLLAKGLMVLLSLLIMVFAFTYSWFNDEPQADAKGIAASVETSGDFEYAIGFYNNGTGGNYKVTKFTNDSQALNLESLKVYDGDASNKDGSDSGGYYHNYNLLHDYVPIDVTGDGRTLIRPSMSYGNQKINTASMDYSIAEQNVQYISFDLYFRSTFSDVPIKLCQGSWAKGNCELNNLGYTGSSANANFNKSKYGDFSKDAIVGAVRIAFVPYDYSETAGNIPTTLAQYEDKTPDYLHDSASLLWLPRPDLHVTDSGSLTGWTLSTSANDNAHTYYNIFECQPAKATGYASDNELYHKVVEYPNTITTSMLEPDNGGNREFTRIDDSVKIGDYYYSKVSVRIWVEGTDAEARRAVSGGKFGVNFKFTTN